MNVFVDGYDHTKKLGKLFTLGPMVSQLRVYGANKNFDYFGEGNANFSTCHDLNLHGCSFTNKQKFENFLVSLESSSYLTSLRFYDLKFQEKAVLNKRLWDIVKCNPI